MIRIGFGFSFCLEFDAMGLLRYWGRLPEARDQGWLNHPVPRPLAPGPYLLEWAAITAAMASILSIR